MLLTLLLVEDIGNCRPVEVVLFTASLTCGVQDV